MTINIVCHEAKKGWIYSRFIEYFRKYSAFDIMVNSPEKCHLLHYLPYYAMPETDKGLCTTWHSHEVETLPGKLKYWEAHTQATQVICQNKRDEQRLPGAKQVMPGVDTDIFRLRSTQRPYESSKLVLGFVGRHYDQSPRKNPALLERIAQLDYVEYRETGGGLSLEALPAFYAGLDLLISPSFSEGGPMAITESLAVGVPVLCMEGVGVAAEFEHGVIQAKGDDHYLALLREIFDSQVYLKKWRSLVFMQELRRQVLRFTWERFVNEHDVIWEELILA